MLKSWLALCCCLFIGSTALSQEFVPYPYQNILSWDTSPFESYTYSSIPFRIMFPPGYDSERTEKYPIIMFFHGSGERGTDNEKQLVHGGQSARNAVNSGEFPGILLYPQHNNGGGTWGSWIDRAKDVIDKLLLDYNVDPNRIYIHGLSGGGEATWRFAGIYPTYPAAIHPMSAAGSNFLEPGGTPEPTAHIPIWLSQGGRDNNPTPAEGNYMINTVRDNWGGNIRYTYYPTLGHNTWNSQYNQPDFFSWFVGKSKTDITIKFSDGSFCLDDVINVTLGVTPGFSNYEWTKNDTTSTVIASGPAQNEIVVSDIGFYYVRFQRGSEWTKWSKPADINRNREPSPSPEITANGKSVNLPSLDGSQSVTLYGPSDKNAYQWYKGMTEIVGAESYQIVVNEAGSYSLSTREAGQSGYEPDGSTPTEYRPDPQGCPSLTSPPIIVTTQNGVNTPAKPSNFFANTLSENSIVINWDDNASDELGYEIYRTTSSGTNYALIQIISGSSQPNPQSYVDSGLDPNITYYYRMRAVNNSGGSAYTQEVSATTLPDSQAPTAPTLAVSKTTNSSVSLEWSVATDNAGIFEYDIYRNNALIATTAETEYTNGGLPINQFFSYVARARDVSGNVSPPSNQVTAVTVNAGLHYNYYHHNNLSNVSQIETNGTLIENGNTPNFDITIRQQNDQFAFIWEGYVYIEIPGLYTFYTDSDDGSKLYINTTQIVNNDGTHGCRERSGSISLSEGFAAIRVLMFENGGGECLDVEWAGPGISKGNIPNNLLFESAPTFPTPPVAPSGLAAVASDYDEIDLTWTDNSVNENGFEIYRSVSSTEGFTLIHLTNANETAWSDTGLLGSTTYYYRIAAINLNGTSYFDGPASATTNSYPALPEAPSDLTLIALDANNVQIDWVDNSNNETGFEIYRTTTDPGTSLATDYALNFDGSNDYVAIDNYFYNSSGIPEMTFEAWVKTSIGSNQIIASFDRNEYFRVEIDGNAAEAGKVGFGIMTSAGQIDLGGNTRIDDDIWHHIATVYDNGVASIYIDGILDASTSLGTTFGSGNIRYGFLAVGSEATGYNGTRGPTDYFQGSLEEIRIWSSARSEEEINDFMTLPLNGDESGLAAYFKIATGSGTVLSDYTSNGAIGNLINGTSWSLLNPALVTTGTFTKIHTSNADVTTYIDSQVFGNSTYYYKVRAVGIGGYSSYSSTENVTTPNRPPVISPILDRSVKFGTTLSLSVIADDPDGDPITFTFTDPLEDFMSFTDNGYGSGEFTFEPELADAGSYLIEVTANDGSGGVDTESFTITVSDNDNPIITPIANYSIDEGYTETLNITVTDAQTQVNVTITAENLPYFVDFVDNGSGNGTFTISPTIGDAGTYPNIRVIASDGDGGFSEETFQITVNEIDPYYSLYINFSTGVSTGPSPWNNIITSNGAQNTANLISNEGIVTDISFKAFDATNAKFNGALTADLPSGNYPDEVQETFWFKYSGTVIMRVQNLNPSLFYNLTLFSGINDDFVGDPLSSVEGQNRTTRFTINGQVQNLYAVDNATITVQFTEIQPDVNNEIVIQVTEAGAHPYFVLNSLIVDAYFNDGQAPAAPGNLNLLASSSSTVNISWTDNSNNETKFEILRSEVSETGPFTIVSTQPINSTSFVDSNLEGSTIYYYKVRAVNNNGQAETDVGLVTTLNAPPMIDHISDVVIKIGETAIVPINSLDPEGNLIFLTSPNLPSFITLTDNGDGTGQFFIEPTSEDLGFSGAITLKALDNFSSETTIDFLVTVIDQQYSEIVYINFDLNSNATAPWNNLEANPGFEPTYSGFTSADDLATTIGLQVGSGWDGVLETGISSGNNSYVYQDNVMRSAWFTYGSATLTLTGLDPTRFYNIDLLGSTSNWERTMADYTVGATTIQAHSTNNTDNILAFNSLVPNGSGEITISLNAITNSVNAYINSMVIKSTTSDIPTNPSNLLAKGISRSEILLTWQDNSFNETGFEIYRTDEPGKAFTLFHTTAPNVTSYTDGSHSQNTAFIYKIRAVGSAGNSDYTNETRAITLDHKIYVNINANIGGFVQASAPWNNTNSVVEPGFTLADLDDELGVATTTDFHVIQHPSGQTNSTGTQTGDNSGIYPDAVMQGYYYLNAFEQSTFELNDLNSGLVYDLSFFGTEDQFTPSFGSGIVEFLAGGQKRTLFTEFNTTENVTIPSLSPDGTNSIGFTMQSSDDNGSRFGFFNALVIDAHKSIDVVFDKTSPTVPTDLVASNIMATGLTLEWSPSADNVGVTGYQVFQNGGQIGTSSLETFDVTGLSPGFTYTFTVRSIDENSNVSEFSESLVITTPVSGAISLFYSPTSGTFDISDINNWRANSNGTGGKPSNFTADNQQFILQANATLSSAMTISGLSSKLIVNDNITLTLNESLTGTVEAGNASTISVNSPSTPTFDILAPSSTVIFGSSSNTIPVAQYGNVLLSSNGSTKNLSAGNILIEGDLTVNNGITVLGAVTNSSEITLKGNLTINGTPIQPTEEQLVTLKFNSGSSQSLNIDSNQDIYLHSIRVSQNTELIVNPPTSTGMLNLGSTAGGGLILETGSILNLSNQTLSITGRGSINGNGETGRISTSKGNISISSNSQINSNLYLETDADSLTNMDIDLTSSGQLNVQTEVNIINEVVVSNGQVNMLDALRLISTLDQTARIAEIQNTGRITGNVEAQRFMEGEGRIYRYLSTPVLSTTVSDWQEYIPITGSFDGASTGPGLSSSPSLYYYDEPAGGWQLYPAASNTEEMEVGRGYAIFVRQGASPTTLRLSGEINQGDFAFNLSGGTGADNGWNLLGNPYPSPIVWSDQGWSFSGVGPGVSIRDNATGDFQVYDRISEVGDPEFSEGHIASGQAFWVQAINSTPSVSISENAKTSSPTTDAIFFRSEKLAKDFSYIRISMDGEGEKDYTHILFGPEFSNEFDPSNDIPKRLNDKGNLYTVSSNDRATAINKLSENFCSVEIPLKISEVINGNYTLNFEIIEEFDFDPILEIYDNLNESTTSLSGNTRFDFEIMEGSNSVGDRFILKISKPEINTNLMIDQSLSRICFGEGEYELIIKDTQKGVIYSVLVDNLPLGHQVVGNGSDVAIIFDTSDLSAGNHNLTVSAGFSHCNSYVLEQHVEVEITPAPSIETNSPQIDVCTGGSTTVMATSDNNEATYSWYVNGTPIEDYNLDYLVLESLTEKTLVQVSASNSIGCSSNIADVSIDIVSLNQPEISLVNGYLTTSTEGADSYQWYLNDKMLVGETTKSIVPPASNGSYTVEVSKGTCKIISDYFDLYKIITDLDIEQSVNTICNVSQEDFKVTVKKSQSGVLYSILIDSEYASDHIVGTGDDLDIPVDISSIGVGVHNLTVQAGLSDTDLYLMEQSVSFELKSPPNITTDVSQLNACEGETMTLTAYSEQTNLTYSWYINNTIVANNNSDSLMLNSIDQDTNIKVYALSDHGCSSNTLYIDITLNSLEKPEIHDENGKLVASSVNVDSYQWYLNHVPIESEKERMLSHPIPEGIYTVEVSLGSCQKISDEYLINGWNDDSIKAIVIRPNPTNDFLYIDHPNQKIEVLYIFDNVGRVIYLQGIDEIDSNQSRLDLSTLKSGVYYVNIITNKLTVNLRVVKN